MKPALCERKYYCHLGPSNEYEPFTATENMEADDHWMVEINLQRWRSRAEWSAYLRAAADAVDALPNSD